MGLIDWIDSHPNLAAWVQAIVQYSARLQDRETARTALQGRPG